MTNVHTPPVRVLPEELANKIAAGEVVERPASVVKELVENALDAHATRVTVRLVAAGRRTVEVTDNGHGMSEQDALMAIERHATSKIRKKEDLDAIHTLGFRGEALASIAAVSRFELLTRREKDDGGTRVRVEGGVLRDVSEAPAPVGTRIGVHRLYFNTPARAKFLKGITTELGQALDVLQRHALVNTGVAWQVYHNDKLLLDIPQNATLRERVALIWGLNFLQDMVPFKSEHGGIQLEGLIGTPALTRSQRTHQFFFLNRRPIQNRALQYGFEDGYRELLTVGRRPVGIVMVQVHPRLADVNIHPAKREVRFRDERAIRDALREAVRDCLSHLSGSSGAAPSEGLGATQGGHGSGVGRESEPQGSSTSAAPQECPPPPSEGEESAASAKGLEHPPQEEGRPIPPEADTAEAQAASPGDAADPPRVRGEGMSRGGQTQTEFSAQGMEDDMQEGGFVSPSAMYGGVESMDGAPMQVFDSYLLVPGEERLLIIDQHALHERLTYDALKSDLEDGQYQAQQLVAPILIDVPPSHSRILERNIEVFQRLGIEIEPFGGNTFQVTAICHLYEEAKIPDVVYSVLDQLAQGELFDQEEFLASLLRLAVHACRGSVKAGDRLSPEERRRLLEGFRKLRPPYTCPHGRPIITELTQWQMEKSFRRRQ
ncbi:MAG: DNA mismatch repair endonuclease MutL [Candidatus Hydrogenedentota bacterium]